MFTFLKPGKKILMTYVPLVIVWILALRDTDWRIDFFPCQTKPVIAPSLNPQFEADWCGLWTIRDDLTGVEVTLDLWSYLLIFVVVLVLPYLLTALLIRLLKKPSVNP